MPGRGISEQERSVRIAGSVARLSVDAFETLLTSDPVDVVVRSPRYLFRTSLAGSGLIQRGWQYLAVSRGLVLHAIKKHQLSIPREIRLIEAEDIWVSFLGPQTTG